MLRWMVRRNKYFAFALNHQSLNSTKWVEPSFAKYNCLLAWCSAKFWPKSHVKTLKKPPALPKTDTHLFSIKKTDPHLSLLTPNPSTHRCTHSCPLTRRMSATPLAYRPEVRRLQPGAATTLVSQRLGYVKLGLTLCSSVRISHASAIYSN